MGAVTGPARVEYSMPPAVADALFGAGSDALCYPNVEHFIPVLQESAERTRSKAKKAQFSQVLAEIEKDVMRLRSSGVRGAIPACVSLTTGSRTGTSQSRSQRRAQATHERFHADARRVEVDAGIDKPYQCWQQIEKNLGPRFTPELRDFSRVYYGNGQRILAAEELLARVEEVRKACETKKGRKQGDCDPTLEKIIKHMPTREAQDFVALIDGIKKNYGTPMNIIRAAVRSCKVP